MTNNTTSLPEWITLETAAAHACTQVPMAAPTTRAGDLRQTLVGQQYESVSHIAICEVGMLRGILRLKEMLAAPVVSPMQTLMDATPPVVAPGVAQEVAAWQAVQHAESALVVVDVVRCMPPYPCAMTASVVTRTLKSEVLYERTDHV